MQEATNRLNRGVQKRDYIHSALNFIPSHDRDTWIKVGMAIKSELGDDGFDLWNLWSQTADNYSAPDAHTAWQSFSIDGEIKIGSLFFIAEQYGFINQFIPSASKEILDKKHQNSINTTPVKTNGTLGVAHKCSELWNKAQPANPSHPYLTSKAVSAYGIRQSSDQLLIPLYDHNNHIICIQFIYPNGKKQFITGGKVKSGHFAIGEPTEIIYLCEGYATGASIHQASGCQVVVAFTVGNLQLVAEMLTKRHPNNKVIICADNDSSSGKNTGISTAKKSAEKLNLRWTYPVLNESKCDFNDLANTKGLGEVISQLAKNLSTAINWRTPEPLSNSLLPVEEFPLDLLPGALKAWAGDISTRMDNGPADYAAVATMAALGSLVGRKFGIHPKQHDDWLVIPNLWGAAVGRPSMKKSPIMLSAFSFLKQFESEAKEAHEKNMANFALDIEVYKQAQKLAGDNAKKALKKGDRKLAREAYKQAEELKESLPTRKRYLINDCTIEKLGEILCDNPMGILLFRDELTGWLTSLEREDRGQDRAFYLEAWNGNGSFVYDRIQRGTIDIESTTVSLFGCIPPGKLVPYLNAQNKGVGDDGLLQRLQMIVYPDPQTFRHVDQSPNVDANEAAREIFQKFDAIPESIESIPALHFSNEAQAVFDEWYCDLMKRARHEPNPHIEAHLAKYPSLMASLALIINLVEFDLTSSVCEISARKAAAWCEYLESHARRIYNLATDPLIGARTLIKRLDKLPNPFRTADFANKGWTGLTNAEEIGKTLDALTQKGYLYPETKQSTTKPRTHYHINPVLLEDI